MGGYWTSSRDCLVLFILLVVIPIFLSKFYISALWFDTLGARFGTRGTFVPIRLYVLYGLSLSYCFSFFCVCFFPLCFQKFVVLMAFKMIITFHRRLVVPTDHCCWYLAKTAVLAIIQPHRGHYIPHSDAFKFTMFIVL